MAKIVTVKPHKQCHRRLRDLKREPYTQETWYTASTEIDGGDTNCHRGRAEMENVVSVEPSGI